MCLKSPEIYFHVFNFSNFIVVGLLQLYLGAYMLGINHEMHKNSRECFLNKWPFVTSLNLFSGFGKMLLLKWGFYYWQVTSKPFIEWHHLTAIQKERDAFFWNLPSHIALIFEPPRGKDLKYHLELGSFQVENAHQYSQLSLPKTESLNVIIIK